MAALRGFVLSGSPTSVSIRERMNVVVAALVALRRQLTRFIRKNALRDFEVPREKRRVVTAANEAEVERLAARSYHYELAREKSGTWFIRVLELKCCMSAGSDPNEAVAMIEDAKRGWIRAGLEYGDPIPDPMELDVWIARR